LGLGGRAGHVEHFVVVALGHQRKEPHPRPVRMMPAGAGITLLSINDSGPAAPLEVRRARASDHFFLSLTSSNSASSTSSLLPEEAPLPLPEPCAPALPAEALSAACCDSAAARRASSSVFFSITSLSSPLSARFRSDTALSILARSVAGTFSPRSFSVFSVECTSASALL